MSQILKEQIIKTLESEIFHVDEQVHDYDYFPALIEKGLSDFMKKIEGADFWKEFLKVHSGPSYDVRETEETFVEMIRSFCLAINKSICSYYGGRVSEAYEYLSAGLNAKGILYKTSKLFKDAIRPIKSNELLLYRVRKKKESIFSRKDMFHIPYHKRSQVSTQRYSIPGHPCLYLGDSIYVCWEELNQPSIKEVYASLFRNVEEIKLIEIIRTKDFISKINNLEGSDLSSDFFRFILTFPLTLATSVRTKDRTAIFKPEFIISQLFMQFVMEHLDEIDGIKYFSTRIDPNKVEKVGTYNFVFPTKTSGKKNGHCTILIKKFELTEPILWEYEELFRENTGMWLRGNDSTGAKIELNIGRILPYTWSTFNSIEGILKFNGKFEMIDD